MENFLQPLLANPRFDMLPSHVHVPVAALGAKLPFLQILHAIQRAENAQRFKGGDGVALAAVNVVFVEPAAIGRCEPAFTLMPAENSFDARFTVNLVQAAENFQGGELEISVLQRRPARREKQTTHIAPEVN